VGTKKENCGTLPMKAIKVLRERAEQDSQHLRGSKTVSQAEAVKRMRHSNDEYSAAIIACQDKVMKDNGE
jgi:hypothetical protein